jgi:hypothetical protein
MGTGRDVTFDPLLEDVSLRLVQLRLAAAAGVSLVDAEPLVVHRFEPGETYRPDDDALSPDAVQRDRRASGARRRSICAYLNTPQAGGALRVAACDVAVDARAGSAVVIDHLDADGRPLAGSLPTALPVERGEAWLATLWLRERAYRAY